MAGGPDASSSPRAPAPPPRAYRLARWLARRLLAGSYRRLEVVGEAQVPSTGPVVLAANHGSGLTDSLALLALLERPTAPLAKAPLWQNRLLARALDAVGAIPVYREQDVEENAGRGVRANLATFEACRARLARGEAVALFPEGVSQPQPRLLPLRTGVARIALDAGRPVTVVPVGLVHEPPGEERGTLLVLVGAPFAADGGALARHERRGAIAALTRRIETDLRALLAEAQSQSDLALLRTLRLAREQEHGAPAAASLAEAHARTQELARGLARLTALQAEGRLAPGTVDALRAQADAFQRSLAGVRLPLALLDTRYTTGSVLRFVATTLLPALLAAPLGLAARLLTAPGRLLGDLLLLRGSGASEDVRGFARTAGEGLGALLTAVLLGTVVGALVGAGPGLLVGLALLLLRRLDVLLRDPLARVRQRVRAFALLAGDSRVRDDLRAQRKALVEAVDAAAAPPPPAAEQPPSVGPRL